ncbi:MAG TPA: glucosamine-6-phosphate deaminase [Arachidicoccus sp.]|nr:glucosamine-6-phosphate deaminase [Arachidicoccus sp.]
MNIIIKNDTKGLGQAAGAKAAAMIKKVIDDKGEARIILATGSSQFETLKALINDEAIDWDKVTMFHLDEYIGLPITHKASFRKYLQERFLDKVPPLKAVHLINGDNDPKTECQRLAALIEVKPIDVALVGIGENGHLAFNDPPADFDTKSPYLVANLDQDCRQQQVNEDWFDNLEAVPPQAISMSVHQIMLSKNIICSVPGSRKARAVKNTIEQPVSNLYPASILQQHANCYFYFEKASAALLKNPL